MRGLFRLARALRGGRSAKRVFAAFILSQCLALLAAVLVQGWWRAYSRDMPLPFTSRWGEALLSTAMAIPFTLFLLLFMFGLPVLGAGVAAALARRWLGRVPLGLVALLPAAWATSAIIIGHSAFPRLDEPSPLDEVLTPSNVARLTALAAIPLLAAWWWVRPPSPPAGTS